MMSHSRAFKIISHLSEALVLEEEEFTDFDMIYTREFAVDFQKELEYLKLRNGNKKEEDPPEKGKIAKSLLRRLHKKLAMITHPDMSNGCIHEFKKIQSAYEKGDGATLMTAARKHNVKIDLTDEEINKMMGSIQLRRKSIAERKLAVRWVWCQSDKNNDLRGQVLDLLGVDPKAYKEWLSKQDSGCS